MKNKKTTIINIVIKNIFGVELFECQKEAMEIAIEYQSDVELQFNKKVYFIEYKKIFNSIKEKNVIKKNKNKLSSFVRNNSEDDNKDDNKDDSEELTKDTKDTEGQWP
ncbi:MAG TPA: hypothetical protein VMZ91_13315 [Candidatus Paceibacterota bacterium]|nr:hypothetical protein [Candidatus Paceibacterota bacterium]